MRSLWIVAGLLVLWSVPACTVADKEYYPCPEGMDCSGQPPDAEGGELVSQWCRQPGLERAVRSEEDQRTSGPGAVDLDVREDVGQRRQHGAQ